MKPLALLSLLLLSLACRQAGSVADIEKEILHLEQARQEALAQHDRDVIDQTMHEAYVFITPQGHKMDKAAELAGFDNGSTHFDQFLTEEVQVRVFGETAVATGRASIVGVAGGQAINGRFGYTRVYHREDGRWQIVSSQFTPLQKPAVPGTEIVTIRPDKDVIMPQGLPFFVGISDSTAGSQGLSLSLVVVPPGAQAKAHTHKGFETALYVLQGSAKTEYGEGLTHSQINQAGDFIYIPPGLPHRPVNLSQTEPAIAIVARTSASEEEAVEAYEVKHE